MTIRFPSKVILAKIESSYGTDPTPTGEANAMLMTQVEWSPMEGEDVSRDLEFPYMAAQGTIPVGLRTRIRGRVELAGSGAAGTAPKWGPLVRACACAQTIVAETSVAYTPITNGQESATIYFWMGNTKQVIKGMRGSFSLRFTAQNIPYLEFDLVGVYAEPSDATPATPTLSGFLKPQIVCSAFTTFSLHSVPLVLRELMLNLNGQVEPRFLVGKDEIVLPERRESATARVEATTMATFNPFALAKATTSVALSLVHGTTAGNIATLAFPTAQVGRPPGVENAQNIAEWSLPLIPLPTSGNDQWSLTLT